MPRLIVLSGVDAGTEVELGAGAHRIGRRNSNRVVLRDRSVSRDHCELVVTDAEVIVADLESANGTLVGGIPLIEPVRLNHDGVIRLGSVSVRIELDRVAWDESTDAVSAVFDMRAFAVRPDAMGRSGLPASVDPETAWTDVMVKVEGEPGCDRPDRGTLSSARPPRSGPTEIASADSRPGLSPATVIAMAATAAFLAMLTLWLLFGGR